MDYLVIIPILALLGLRFVSLGSKRPSLKTAAVVWVIGIALFVAARYCVPEELLFRESEAVRRVQSQLRHLQKTKDWQKHPVIILEGSSLSLVGIDGALLETKLREAGKPATVLQFNMAGANHVERRHLLDLFFKSLKPKDRESLRETKVILLSEVMKRYDEHPLVFLTNPEYTERARIYLTPANAWTALRYHQLDATPMANILPTAIEGTFANIFAIGAFSDMKIPGRIRGIGGYFPLQNTSSSFDFEKSRTAAERLPITILTTSENPYPWLRNYYAELHAQTGDLIDHAGFYGMPLLDLDERAYQHAFRGRLDGALFMIQPDPQTFRDMSRAEFWFDHMHVQEKGAKPATEWLAREIILHWDDLTKTPWNGAIN